MDGISWRISLVAVPGIGYPRGGSLQVIPSRGFPGWVPMERVTCGVPLGESPGSSPMQGAPNGPRAWVISREFTLVALGGVFSGGITWCGSNAGGPLEGVTWRD
jgi:hypothetical protein